MPFDFDEQEFGRMMHRMVLAHLVRRGVTSRPEVVVPHKKSLFRLPDEILLDVLHRMDYATLHTLRNSCKRFRQLIKSSEFDKVMFRQVYDAAAIKSAFKRYAAAGLPGTVYDDKMGPKFEGPFLIPHAAFPIKLHPALQAVHWTTSKGGRKLTYNWPIHEGIKTSWMEENSTSPPVNFLSLMVDHYQFFISRQEKGETVKVGEVLECILQGFNETANTKMELQRTAGPRDAKKNGTRWLLPEKDPRPQPRELPDNFGMGLILKNTAELKNEKPFVVKRGL
ncbi:hypothetical protein V8E36_000156 [Tilletia maclaganii]